MKYECHGHIIADGLSYADSMERHKNGIDEAFVRNNLKTVANHGIGFYRDGGDKLMVSAFVKKIAGEFGVDYRTPIYITHKTGHYGSMYGRAFSNMKELYALVREAKTLNADFIKITVSGMLDFNDEGKITGPVFSTAELQEAVNISSGEGFAVMAHVNGAQSIKNALEAGVNSIEHGFWPDSSVIGYFLETGAVWVPTSATVHNLLGTGRYNDAVLRNILEHQKAVLKEAYASGVLIASGSDCGAFKVGQGSGTDDEYTILQELAIDPVRGNKAIEEIFRRS